MKIYIILIIVLLIGLMCYWAYSRKITHGAGINSSLDFQQLWMEHMYYTREYILRYVYHLPNLNEETNRLLQNQSDLANAIDSIYPGTFDTVKKLLDDHILIAAKLVQNADKNHGSLDAQGKEINAQWRQNAIDIANALYSVNKKYNLNVLKEMLLHHLDTTIDEVVAIINNKSGIPEYDTAVNHMMKFSNYLLNP